MKILIISDSHGNVDAIKTIIEAERKFDYLLHCGDGINDLMYVSVPEGVFVITVCGNIDRARGINEKSTIVETIGNFKFFITHGDVYGAHHDITGVWIEAKRSGCDIACFGHTHKPYHTNGSPMMFNPGAAQSGFYGIIETGDSLKAVLKRI